MPNAASTQPILVTGASGFIGACLCQRFASLGRRVVAVHRSSSVGWRLEGTTGIETVRVDVEATEDVRALFRDVRPDVVINCAVYGAYSHQADADRIYRVNFDAARHMLDAAAEIPGLRAFVQAGTSSEYGFDSAGPREDAAGCPDSDYAVAKLAATEYLRYAGRKRRVPAWVLRLYSVYGPYEDASRLIPKVLASAAERRLPKLVNPDISRDFVFIDDVCDAFAGVIERAHELEPGDVFNIGTGRRTTLRDLVALVRARYEITEEPAWGSMADRPWDRRDWYADPRKADAVLGWRARTTLEEGLSRTSDWMRSNPEVVRTAMAQSVVNGS